MSKATTMEGSRMNSSEKHAHKVARGQSMGRTIFVAEWIDEPGRFSPVADREYYWDGGNGDFYREAVAEYSDKKRVS